MAQRIGTLPLVHTTIELYSSSVIQLKQMTLEGHTEICILQNEMETKQGF